MNYQTRRNSAKPPPKYKTTQIRFSDTATTTTTVNCNLVISGNLRHYMLQRFHTTANIHLGCVQRYRDGTTQRQISKMQCFFMLPTLHHKLGAVE